MDNGWEEAALNWLRDEASERDVAVWLHINGFDDTGGALWAASIAIQDGSIDAKEFCNNWEIDRMVMPSGAIDELLASPDCICMGSLEYLAIYETLEGCWDDKDRVESVLANFRAHAEWIEEELGLREKE